MPRARLAPSGRCASVLRHEHAALCRERAPLALVARCRERLRPESAAPAPPDRVAGRVLAASAARVSRRSRWRRRSSSSSAPRVIYPRRRVRARDGRRTRRRSREVRADEPCARHRHEHEDGAQADAERSSWLVSTFAWAARLPEAPEQAGLELVGSQTCLYGQGTVAHIMYRDIRHQGEMVSVFMLPGQTRTDALVARSATGGGLVRWADARSCCWPANRAKMSSGSRRSCRVDTLRHVSRDRERGSGIGDQGECEPCEFAGSWPASALWRCAWTV